jgi:hypothetical protein
VITIPQGKGHNMARVFRKASKVYPELWLIKSLTRTSLHQYVWLTESCYFAPFFEMQHGKRLFETY